MSFDRDTLLQLLPVLYRMRDRDPALTAGSDEGPLGAWLAIVADEIAIVEEDLEQLYDDSFIETCAEWAVPYIGDLIGYRGLYGVAPKTVSQRAEVAHTVAYRRRKGAATVLEQLARDVTGWPAHVVEFFQCVITTQYMNHLRPWVHAAPDLRGWEPLERVGTAFDRIPRTVDVRCIASQRGRHNIPHVGVFLFRVAAHSLTRSPAARVDGRRYRFSPLNHDAPLFTRPQTEDEITQLSSPLNVPVPISQRVLRERPWEYYSSGTWSRSLRLYVGTADPLSSIAVSAVRICNLANDAGIWAHLPPAGQYAVDPVLGRIALPPGLPADTRVEVDFHYGFPADIGGGEYERGDRMTAPTTLRVPDDHASIQDAIDALHGEGVVEITNSGRYEESLLIEAAAGKRVEVRAGNGHRPTIVLNGALTLAGGDDSEIRLDGLLLAGDRLHVTAAPDNLLRRLNVTHCTLVPGWTLTEDSLPGSFTATSLVVEIANLAVTVERSVVGALRMHDGSECEIRDAIVDACAMDGVAYSAPDDQSAGGPVSFEGVTMIGKLHAVRAPLISNSILLAQLESGSTWIAPLIVTRRQEGCVRFSYVPTVARVPRRFHCVPGEDTSMTAAPQFVSLRYGHYAYAQLNAVSGPALLAGASDDGEMGALHRLAQPQRETNLRVRLDEYLRVGLEAGVFYES